MIITKSAAAVLGHRLQERPYFLREGMIERRSLDQNQGSDDRFEGFGESTFEAYVGFVDIVGHTARLQSRAGGRPSPPQVMAYLKPFIDVVVTELTAWAEEACMIDKTSGDEVMFLQPIRTKVLPGAFALDGSLQAIKRASIRLGPDYPLRVGIALGSVCVAKVGGAAYDEVALFGETITLARRLCDHHKSWGEGACVRGHIAAATEQAHDRMEIDRQSLWDAEGWQTERLGETLPLPSGVEAAWPWRFRWDNLAEPA